jgi:hypothetical protein
VVLLLDSVVSVRAVFTKVFVAPLFPIRKQLTNAHLNCVCTSMCVQHQVLSFNKLAMAACPGMLSPIIAVAAIATFLAQCGMQALLGDSATARLFPNHPLPVNCIAMLMIFHSL